MPRTEPEPDRGDVWASPPTGSRASERGFPVAAHEGAEAWLTAPSADENAGARERPAVVPVAESVEWIEIVEDLRRDVAGVEVVDTLAAVEVVDTRAEPIELQTRVPAAEDEGSTVLELVPAESRAVEPTEVFVALRAVLTISLEPEWPGNVHVYEITVDMRDGSFSGFAAQSSNIPGETICGIFSDGFADIDFTAAYPTPGYHYAWFGAGRLREFIATDSHGNVMHTVAGAVTNLTYVSNDLPADDPATLRPALIAVDPPVDELRAVDRWYDEGADAEADDVVIDLTDDVAVAVAEPIVASPAVDEELEQAPIAVAVVPDAVEEIEDVPEIEDAPEIEDLPTVEVVPEIEDAPTVEVVPEVADVIVETPDDDVPEHDADCQCLGCRWSAFKPEPVTEGPLAGKAFYFHAGKQDVRDHDAITETERSPDRAT